MCRLQCHLYPSKRVASEPAASSAFLDQVHRLGEELVCLRVGAPEDRLPRIVRAPTLPSQIHHHRPDHGVHGHLSRVPALGALHRDEACQEVHVLPLERELFAPSKTGVDRNGEQWAQVQPQRC